MTDFTVKDMYDYASTHQLKLLSDFNDEFWNEYKLNYLLYDKAFTRLYKGFKYFDQEDTESIAELTVKFIGEVNNHLLLNKKKYEELYRINVISDEEYDFKNNLDYTKVTDEDTTENNTYISGTRSDSSTENLGAQSNNIEQQVSAYDSTSYSPEKKNIESIGAKSNSISTTKGQETDTNSNRGTNDSTVTVTGKDSDTPISSLISSHIKLWDKYQFYTSIFNDICYELLLVD